MRVLAYFTFSFAAGAGLILWNPGRWVIGLCIVLFLLIGLSLFSRGRIETTIRILAIGLLCGLLWTGWHQNRMTFDLDPEATWCYTAELTDYPTIHAFGCTVQAVTKIDGETVRLRLCLQESDPAWKPGDRLTGIGALAHFEADETGAYYRSIGVWVEGTMTELTEVTVPERIPLRYKPAVWAQSLRETIAALYPSDVRGYMEALLTGEKSNLTYQQKSDLQMAGIYHTLAVSGMHVAILMSALGILTLRSRRLLPILGIPTLIVYCLMVGCAASVIRAAVMQGFLLLGPLCRRESDAPTALGAALFCLTVENPWCLTNVGLQLSFLATIGMLVCNQRICEGLYLEAEGVFRKILRNLRAIFAQTCGALIFTTPVMVFQFEIVSVMAIVANLLMVTAITACFVMGFVSCGLWYVIPIAARVLAWPAILLFRYVIWLSGILARCTFAAIYPQVPYVAFWIVFAYGLILLFFFGKTCRKRLIACGAAGALCMSMLFAWTDRDAFTFKALDVGQGQCLYLESGKCTAAIDCGGSYGDEAGEMLARELLSGGRVRLNYLILTHFDEDHTGGVRQLLNRVPVEVLLVSDCDWENAERQELLRLAVESGTEVCLVREDLAVSVGQGSLQIFAPVDDSGGNKSCLSVLATFDEYDILATGDLSAKQEKQLVETHCLPDIELLVAGHHGSSAATGAEFLAAIKPECVIISVGKNRYGHPDREVLDRIAEIGASVFRTDQSGTITVRR